MSRLKLLQIALMAFGVVFCLVYPLAIVWPSGWAWHDGPPAASHYFLMIVGIYARRDIPDPCLARPRSTSVADRLHDLVECCARANHGGPILRPRCAYGAYARRRAGVAAGRGGAWRADLFRPHKAGCGAETSATPNGHCLRVPVAIEVSIAVGGRFAAARRLERGEPAASAFGMVICRFASRNGRRAGPRGRRPSTTAFHHCGNSN